MRSNMKKNLTDQKIKQNPHKREGTMHKEKLQKEKGENIKADIEKIKDARE